jgi:uncharacterized RDD family membrane protein YckC
MIIWLVGGAQTLLLFYYGDVFVKLKAIEVIFCMILLLYMYVKIYLTAQQSRNTCSRMYKNRVHQEETSHLKAKNLIQNVKLAKSCFLVVMSSYVCFLPACIIVGIIHNRNEVVYMAQMWSETFLLLNSSLNSVLFFWRNNGLRKEALILIGCTFVNSVV